MTNWCVNGSMPKEWYSEKESQQMDVMYMQRRGVGCGMTADSRKNNYFGGCGKVRDGGKHLFPRVLEGMSGLIAPEGTCGKL
eukprot:1157860-Pelagomonas_calceolata.AAC.3